MRGKKNIEHATVSVSPVGKISLIYFFADIRSSDIVRLPNTTIVLILPHLLLLSTSFIHCDKTHVIEFRTIDFSFHLCSTNGTSTLLLWRRFFGRLCSFFLLAF